MRSPIAHTRIFVALTLDEAAAIGRLTPGPDPDALSGVAKIRTALAGVTRPPPAADGPVPPQRAKEYRPLERRLSMAKAAIRPPRSQPPPRAASADASLNEYIPHRDEAGGIFS